MKVKLSVLNRLSIVGLLPETGPIATLRINRELREELSCTEEEYKLCNFRPSPDGKMSWDDTAVPPKEFEFAKGSVREVLAEEVKTKLREMEKAGTLKMELISLYEVLVEEVEPDLKLVKDG